MKGPATDHAKATPDQEGKWSSAPSSDSEELVPVAPDQEMGASQVGKRCPAPDSDSEELVPAAPSQDVEQRLNLPWQGASDHQPSVASRPRPWTPHDTDLSKAL